MASEQILKRGRVALSFDDEFVDRWYEAHNMLKKYNWRATFFVSKFRILSGEEIEMLKELEAYGHEIAAHTVRHLDANAFANEHGIDAYMEAEIDPMLSLMEKEGFFPTSFAYPYGRGNDNPELTNALLKRFKVVRSLDNQSVPPSQHKCVNNDSNHVYGAGIDNHQSITMQEIKAIIDYAKQEGKTAIFYAHKPVKKVGTGNFIQIEYQRLIDICEYINANDLEYTTITECYIQS